MLRLTVPEPLMFVFAAIDPRPLNVPRASVIPDVSVRVAPEEILPVPLSVRLPVTVRLPPATFSVPELERPPVNELVLLLLIVPELLMPPVVLIVPPATLIVPAVLV